MSNVNWQIYLFMDIAPILVCSYCPYSYKSNI